MNAARGYDAVVAGAGAAGLMTALRAAFGGAHVALLSGPGTEQSNLWASTGLFSAAGTRWQAAHSVDDSPARWADDILRKTGGAVDASILQVVTGRSADAAHFLADQAGVEIHLATSLTLPGHTAQRLHATPTESGQELARALLAAVRKAPSIVELEETATSLLVEHGRVCGVRTAAGEARGRWTVLASGGFAADAAMVARHLQEIAGAVYIGLGPNDGWAAKAGAALGGELLLMDSYQGQGHTTPDGKARLGPGLTSFGAIVVNAKGERFANEDLGPSEFGAHVLAQQGGTAVELFDRHIHEQAMRMSSYRDAVEHGAVLEAADLAGIAARFGLPATTLAATLADYHATVAGASDSLGRRTGLYSLEPPFMAARVTGALAHTQGGLRVDTSARVLRTDGEPIPGLLAAGGAACGISGHGAAGYLPGNGLGQAFSIGLAAGETISSAQV